MIRRCNVYNMQQCCLKCIMMLREWRACMHSTFHSSLYRSYSCIRPYTVNRNSFGCLRLAGCVCVCVSKPCISHMCVLARTIVDTIVWFSRKNACIHAIVYQRSALPSINSNWTYFNHCASGNWVIWREALLLVCTDLKRTFCNIPCVLFIFFVVWCSILVV